MTLKDPGPYVPLAVRQRREEQRQAYIEAKGRLAARKAERRAKYVAAYRRARGRIQKARTYLETQRAPPKRRRKTTKRRKTTRRKPKRRRREYNIFDVMG